MADDYGKVAPQYDSGSTGRVDALGVFIVGRDGKPVYDLGAGGGGGGGSTAPAALPKLINRSGMLTGPSLDFTNPDNPVTTPAVPVTVVQANPDRREGGTLINLVPYFEPPVRIWCKWIVNAGDVARAPVFDPDLNRTVYDPGSFYLGPGDQLSLDSQQALSIVLDSGGSFPYSCYEAVEA